MRVPKLELGNEENPELAPAPSPRTQESET
jgi:hypothetical protein